MNSQLEADIPVRFNRPRVSDVKGTSLSGYLQGVRLVCVRTYIYIYYVITDVAYVCRKTPVIR